MAFVTVVALRWAHWQPWHQALRALGLGPHERTLALLSVYQRRSMPEFHAATIQGSPLEATSLQGKVAVIDFWATWCAPCRQEVSTLVAVQEKYRARGVQLIGISMDDNASTVRAFYDAQGMNYPVVLADVHLAESFGGVLGVPLKFFVDRQGRIAARIDGPTSRTTLEHMLDLLLTESSSASVRR